MKRTPGKNENRKAAQARLRLLAAVVILALIPVLLYAAAPSWWTERSVLVTSGTANDYAAVNIGQLKHIATQAAAELDARLPGGAGTNVTAMVATFSATSGNYYAANIGQLKNVAKPFYDRLIEVGHTTNYPWAGATGINDYAVANIGQVKNLFSFDLSNFDSDSNGLPDWWEGLYFEELGQDPDADPDGDGLTNLEEYQGNSDPLNYYSQGGALITPTLSIVSGTGQAGAASTFAPSPLVVLVTNGTAVLSNAPLTFLVLGSSNGKVALGNNGSGLSTALSVRSGTSGLAEAYFKFPAAHVTSSTIQATAGSGTSVSQVHFTATTTGPSGLSLWLKADAGVTVSGSGVVTSWADQSGNGKDFGQSWADSRPTLHTNVVNGLPAVRFDGHDDFLEFSGSTGWGVGQFSVTVLLRPNSHIDSNQRILAKGEWGQFFFHTTSGGSLYVGTDVTNRMTPEYVGGQIPFNTLARNAWQIFTFTYSGSTGRLFKDGNLVAEKTMDAPATWTGFMLGYGHNGQTLDGDLTEVLIYDHALTDAERNQEGAYLAGKYNIYHTGALWPREYPGRVRREIVRNKWNRSQAEAYRAFLENNPAPETPLDGTVLWLKADAGVAVSGSSVTNWEDQGPFGRDVAPTTAGPTLVSGTLNSKPVLRFDGTSQSLRGATSPELQVEKITMLAAYRMDASGDHPKLISHQYDVNLHSRAWEFSSPYNWRTIQAGVALNGSIAYSNSVIQASGTNVPQVAAGVFDGRYSKSYLNNVSQIEYALTGKINYGQWTSPSYFRVGARVDEENFWSGDIAEILVYNRPLNGGELTQTQGYLSGKYGIGLAAPMILPYGGAYVAPVEVTLGPAPEDMEIRYTLDGSDPTVESPLYEEPFELNRSAPVKCAFFLEGSQVGPINHAEFYVNDTWETGMTDEWQMQYFGYLDVDPNDDPTGSGLTNRQKYLWGYDPTKYSSNDSGLSDAQNHQLGYAGNNYDIDGDGLTNAQEIAQGTSPFDVDTDHDGVNDSLDAYPLDPTRWTLPEPDPEDETGPAIFLFQPSGAVLVDP